jgi:hypothetical protein
MWRSFRLRNRNGGDSGSDNGFADVLECGHPVQCRDVLPAELLGKVSEQVGNKVANPAAFWFDIGKSSVVKFTLHPPMP